MEKEVEEYKKFSPGDPGMKTKIMLTSVLLSLTHTLTHMHTHKLSLSTKIITCQSLTHSLSHTHTHQGPKLVGATSPNATKKIRLAPSVLLKVALVRGVARGGLRGLEHPLCHAVQ